jgi:hypothetical protein
MRQLPGKLSRSKLSRKLKAKGEKLSYGTTLVYRNPEPLIRQPGYRILADAAH